VVDVAPELVTHPHAARTLSRNDGEYLYGTRGGPDPHQAAVLDAQRSRVLRIQRSPIALHLFHQRRDVVRPGVVAGQTAGSRDQEEGELGAGPHRSVERFWKGRDQVGRREVDPPVGCLQATREKPPPGNVRANDATGRLLEVAETH